MSELNSLYINVQIKKEKLEQFFRAKPHQAGMDDNWRQWWDSREMYNKEALIAIPSYRSETNRAVLDELLRDEYFGAMEQYDTEKLQWTFAALNFSENYYEILSLLAFLKHLAEYTEGGFSIIYDWMWGGDSIMAFVEFEQGKALLEAVSESTQLAPGLIEKADKNLEDFAKILAGKRAD
ncbi:hypothetical protein [Sphingobacterium detergens]|uniref:hypothetical protein n=1 Tax=Sphingobacterium detergens TaxID=1145106 RepID=UPI003AAD44ED